MIWQSNVKSAHFIGAEKSVYFKNACNVYTFQHIIGAVTIFKLVSVP